MILILFIDGFAPASSANENFVKDNDIDIVAFGPVSLSFPVRHNYDVLLQPIPPYTISISIQSTHNQREMNRRITKCHQKAHTSSTPNHHHTQKTRLSSTYIPHKCAPYHKTKHAGTLAPKHRHPQPSWTTFSHSHIPLTSHQHTFPPPCDYSANFVYQLDFSHISALFISKGQNSASPTSASTAPVVV